MKLSEDKKNEIAEGVGKFVDAFRWYQEAPFCGRFLPVPLLMGTHRNHPDFLDDGMAQRFWWCRVTDIQRGVKYRLIDMIHSDASIGGTGFDEVAIPDDYEKRVAIFLGRTARRAKQKDGTQIEMSFL